MKKLFKNSLDSIKDKLIICIFNITLRFMIYIFNLKVFQQKQNIFYSNINKSIIRYLFEQIFEFCETIMDSNILIENLEQEQLTMSSLIEKGSIIQCRICLENYNLTNKLPLTICFNNHLMCSLCYKSGGLKKHYFNGKQTRDYLCPFCNQTVLAKSVPKQNEVIIDVIKLIQTIKNRKYLPSDDLLEQKQLLKQKFMDLTIEYQQLIQELIKLSSVSNENKNKNERLQDQYFKLQEQKKRQEIILQDKQKKNQNLISKIYELEQICYDVLNSDYFEFQIQEQGDQLQVQKSPKQPLHATNFVKQLKQFFDSPDIKQLLQQNKKQEYFRQLLSNQNIKKTNVLKQKQNKNGELCFRPCKYNSDAKFFYFGNKNMIEKKINSIAYGVFGSQTLKFGTINIFKFKIKKTKYGGILFGLGPDELRGVQNPYWDRKYWGYCLRNGRTTSNIVHNVNQFSEESIKNRIITMQVDLCKNLLKVYIDDNESRKLKLNLDSNRSYFPIIIMRQIGDKIQILPKEF